MIVNKDHPRGIQIIALIRDNGQEYIVSRLYVLYTAKEAIRKFKAEFKGKFA